MLTSVTLEVVGAQQQTRPMQRTYPAGVTSWIDLQQDDVDAAAAFYSALLGWTFEHRMPPDSPFRYAIARLDGDVVAALCGPGEGPGAVEGLPGATGWQTYVAVDDAASAASAVTAAGGRVLQPPTSAGPAGTSVACADPRGLVFRLWQAGERLGAELLNTPGAWNFSNLRTDDPSVVEEFYVPVLGWRAVDQGWATALQVPGYGDHLAATVDPGIRERQAGAPDGFEDVIGSVAPRRRYDSDELEPMHWDVVVTVEDRDASAALAEHLGARVLLSAEDDWSRTAVVRDPQGAVLTLSQFTPPDSW